MPQERLEPVDLLDLLLAAMTGANQGGLRLVTRAGQVLVFIHGGVIEDVELGSAQLLREAEVAIERVVPPGLPLLSALAGNQGRLSAWYRQVIPELPVEVDGAVILTAVLGHLLRSLEPRRAELTDALSLGGAICDLRRAFWLMAETVDAPDGVLAGLGDAVLSSSAFTEAAKEPLGPLASRLLPVFSQKLKPADAAAMFGFPKKTSGTCVAVFIARGWLTCGGIPEVGSIREVFERADAARGRVAAERSFVQSFKDTSQSGNPYAVLGIKPGANFADAQAAHDRLAERVADSSLHSDTVKAYSKELGFIRMALANALATIGTGEMLHASSKREMRVELDRALSRREMDKTDIQMEQEKGDHEADRYYRRGLDELEMERKFDAEQMFRLAVQMRPEHHAYLFALGKLLSENPHPRVRKQAEDYLCRARELNLFEPEYLVALARFYVRHKLPGRAEEMIRDLAKLASNHPDLDSLRKAVKSLSAH